MPYPGAVLPDPTLLIPDPTALIPDPTYLVTTLRIRYGIGTTYYDMFPFIRWSYKGPFTAYTCGNMRIFYQLRLRSTK